MGVVQSTDFSNDPLKLASSLPVWTQEDVTKAWASEDLLTNDARRRRYKCGKNYVTLGDVKPWDLQVQGAIAAAVGSVIYEVKENAREEKRTVLKMQRKEERLKLLRQLLVDATDNGKPMEYARAETAQSSDRDLVNILATAKWEAAKAAESVLEDIEDKRVMGELKANTIALIAKRAPTAVAVKTPSEMDLRTLLHVANKDVASAGNTFAELVAVIDAVHADLKEEIGFEEAYRMMREVDFKSVNDALDARKKEDVAVVQLVEKAGYTLHGSDSGKVDSKLVRNLLRRFDLNIDEAMMAYAKEKNRREKATQDLIAKLAAQGVTDGVTEEAARALLESCYWSVDYASKKWGKKEDAAEGKKEEEKKHAGADAAGAAGEAKGEEGDAWDWETRQKRAEATRQQEVKDRDTPLVSRDKPVEPNTEINKLVAIFNGDITTIEVDAVLNAANSTLLGGGGIDGAIHKAAGQKLLLECATLGGAKVGETKITRGYNLPAKHVLHTVGPMGPDATALESCYTSALDLCRERKLKTIALCAVSTGIYGYPLYAATHVAIYTVRKWLDIKENRRAIDKIIFCTYMGLEHTAYLRIAPLYFPGPGQDTFTLGMRLDTMRRQYGDPAVDKDLQTELANMTYDDIEKDHADVPASFLGSATGGDQEKACAIM